MKKALGFLMLGLLNVGVFAHEGHDHGTAKPQPGVMKKGKSMAVELVQEGTLVKIFVHSADLKPLPIQEVTLKGTAQVPRKKSEAVVFDKTDKYFVLKYDPKGAYRYELSMEASALGKSENFKIQIETHE